MSETPTPTTETATAITTPETPTTVGGWVEFLRNKIGSRTPEEIAAYEAKIAEDRDREARESKHVRLPPTVSDVLRQVIG